MVDVDIFSLGFTCVCDKVVLRSVFDGKQTRGSHAEKMSDREQENNIEKADRRMEQQALNKICHKTSSNNKIFQSSSERRENNHG